jgi:penicillin-binding protein 2
MRNRLLPFQGPRLIFFSVAMFCTFLILITRLYEFQVIEYDSFKAKANENSIQSVPLPAPRGVIYDRFGTALALNTPAFNVSITPAYLPDDDAQTLDVLNRLSALIDVPATRAAADAAGKRNIRSLEQMVTEGQGIAPYRPVVVATDVKQQIAQIILEDIQNLPGVTVQTASAREYPSGATTAQIVGYLGPVDDKEAKALREQGYDPRFERVGYAGVEAYLEKDLAGKRGFLTQTVDVAGLPVNVIKRNEPVAGKNVRLTIDLALQQYAEQALSDRINIINAEAQKLQTISGVVIAMNPKTGEILALVSLPTYDNTRFARQIDGDYFIRIAQEAQTPLVDHATQSQYPPGSVWKLITSTGVLEEKVVPVDYKLYDPGDLIVENSFAKNDTAQRQRFVCWLRTGHGAVDLIRAIAWSCDVYFYQVGGGNPDPKVSSVLRSGGLGIEDMYRYSTALGIGVETGIELPYEAGGRMPDRTWKRRNWGESWSTGDTYNAAFGQGYVTVSPLQLVSAVASIINDGTYYQPTVIKDWLDSEGNLIQAFTPQVQRTIALPADGSPAVLNMREDMLVQGKNSLACVCEANSPYRDPTNSEYDPNLPKCTQDFINNYKQTADLTGRGKITYTVHVPYNYTFGGVCNQLQINDAIYRNYQPPFVSLQNLKYIQEGMREAVTIAGGTAPAASLGYVDVAGKTGTAEYCDDIAAPLGLCIQGQWPSHAWFVGYAPFENPEIVTIAFVYNAGEGSKNALPVVKNVLDCFFKLKAERAQLGETAQIPPCTTSQ